jgi:hypothetical protein
MLGDDDNLNGNGADQWEQALDHARKKTAAAREKRRE